MDLASFLKDILFVIVLYEKKSEESAAYISVRQIFQGQPFLPSIFIYDNSRSPSIRNPDPAVAFIYAEKNNGVSKAYNRASIHAGTIEKKWMLLLDQDTILGADVLNGFFHYIEMFPLEHVFVPRMSDNGRIISPFKTIFGKGYRVRSVSSGKKPIKNYRIINSGMLISTDVFTKAGGYDEDFPLDLSDFVFGERLSSLVKNFVVIDNACQHNLSTNYSRPFLEELTRFKHLNRAAKLYSVKTKRWVLPVVVLIPRSLRLAWQHKRFSFIRIALQTVFSKS